MTYEACQQLPGVVTFTTHQTLCLSVFNLGFGGLCSIRLEDCVQMGPFHVISEAELLAVTAWVQIGAELETHNLIFFIY